MALKRSKWDCFTNLGKSKFLSLKELSPRTCAREGVKKISDARKILKEEIREYNQTRGIVLRERFQKALREKRSLFREFEIPKPYESIKDIFCFRISRTTDGYRKFGISNVMFKVNGCLFFK